MDVRVVNCFGKLIFCLFGVLLLLLSVWSSAIVKMPGYLAADCSVGRAVTGGDVSIQLFGLLHKLGHFSSLLGIVALTDASMFCGCYSPSSGN